MAPPFQPLQQSYSQPDARIAHALEYSASCLGEIENHLSKIARSAGGIDQLAAAITALGGVLAQRLPLDQKR